MRQKARLATGAGLIENKAFPNMSSMLLPDGSGEGCISHDVGKWAKACESFYWSKFRTADVVLIKATRAFSRQITVEASHTADQYEQSASITKKLNKCHSYGVALLSMWILQRSQRTVFASTMNSPICC